MDLALVEEFAVFTVAFYYENGTSSISENKISEFFWLYFQCKPDLSQSKISQLSD